MKPTTELMEVKGVKVPKFNEPKGMEFEKAMSEINAKVRKQTDRRNNSVSQINRIKAELNKVKADYLMAEDEFEEMELKKRKKALQEELESIDDYSGINVEEYAKKLVSNPVIQKLEEEARAEYIKIRDAVSKYENELDNQYKEAKLELLRFSADSGSDSNYRIGARSFSTHKNA